MTNLLLGGQPQDAETLERIIERRSEYLADYQNEALAERYLGLVERVRSAELEISNSDKLTRAAAKSYFKLLSYKDEYEVARLHTQTDFLQSIRQEFGDKARLRFHLAPPVLNARVDARGRPQKREFGAWVLPVFRLLAALRGLRGTVFDVFGFTSERRSERALIDEFETNVDELLEELRPQNVGAIAAIIGKYMEIRGFGPVKEQSVDDVREQIEAAIQALGAEDRVAA